jgi:hypothetical protein
MSLSQLAAEVYEYGNVFDEVLTAGNRLTKLFAALTEESRRDLDAMYERSSLTAVAPSLEQALAMFDNAFSEWRYQFEGKAKPLNTKLLRGLIGFFDGALLQLTVRNNA